MARIDVLFKSTVISAMNAKERSKWEMSIDGCRRSFGMSVGMHALSRKICHLTVRCNEFALIAAFLVLSACAATPRPERSLDQLLADKKILIVRQNERFEVAVDKIVARMEMIKSGKASDTAYDVLLLSGGGDWGVFGAAFLIGWLENQDVPIPEFDYVAGISTGSLIAAFTFSGEEERFRQMEQFYLAADENFVTLGGVFGLGILPFIRNDAALADTSKVEAAVRAAIDDELVDEILAGSAQNRILAAGAVNLDMGLFDAFDLGAELERAEDPKERLTKILLASSAVPAAFPPVEIDGDLYADGGASVGIPIFRLGMLSTVFERWRERHGDAPPPIHFWLIFNNKLGVPPHVTARGWSDILLRAYKIALQTTLVAPLYSLNQAAELAERSSKTSIDLRWVAIPEGFKEMAADAAFVPEVMRELSTLGHQMGGDATSWQSEVPEL